MNLWAIVPGSGDVNVGTVGNFIRTIDVWCRPGPPLMRPQRWAYWLCIVAAVLRIR